MDFHDIPMILFHVKPARTCSQSGRWNRWNGQPFRFLRWCPMFVHDSHVKSLEETHHLVFSWDFHGFPALYHDFTMTLGWLDGLTTINSSARTPCCDAWKSSWSEWRRQLMTYGAKPGMCPVKMMHAAAGLSCLGGGLTRRDMVAQELLTELAFLEVALIEDAPNGFHKWGYP